MARGVQGTVEALWGGRDGREGEEGSGMIK